MGEDMLNTMKYISTVLFSGLINWSVQYLNDSKIAFSKAYPMMRIGEFLMRNKTTVTIQNGIKYKRVTIRIRNGGVIPRDEVMGENIGTKRQFLVSKGQFILSKIDARNGAMGIIPTELDGAIVTQDFLPYDIDTSKINPQYFVLVCTTNQFVAFCQSCSSGTTNRQRVNEAQFLNIKVPVPSLEEQEELIATYDKQISLAINSELEIAAKQHDINNLLFNRLEIEITKNDPLKRLSIVSFSALQRWDHAYLQNNAKLKSVYPLIGLSDCIESFMKSVDGKSLRVETYKAPSQEFHYIGMEHIEKSTGELIDIPIVKGEQIKSQTVAVPKGYFIYGKLRPYLNKYWYNNDSVKFEVVHPRLSR
ncbi:MAG TPA: restriction endonuclease subunit S [Muribaculaceae bacterium]|nr:restriction endonuclease subunit S [Muribaculaceae bacterium]